ncbi:hypothetical protein RDI58_023914 [Solanum bulbocastanum]|uniref:Uncharacterized protein n=1 Tax=Solanum bulbocastanum TaxID=147425 RepID=A0AAN8T215_SOLBU
MLLVQYLTYWKNGKAYEVEITSGRSKNGKEICGEK